MKNRLRKIIDDTVLGVMVLAFVAMLILAFLLPFLLVGAAAAGVIEILRWAATS